MSDTAPIPPASERERFEAWYFDKYCAPIRKVSDGTYGGGRHYSYVEDERLFEVWCAALSHPSTPQGWKQIGWTCGEGDPEWPDVSPEGLRKMAEIAAPNNARVFHAAADVIEALQSRGPRP